MSQTKTLKFNSIIKVLGIYTLATALCLGILIWVMRLWEAKLYIPFNYFLGTDGFTTAILAKHVIDNGWTLHNHFIGMPYGLDMHDFPIFDTFHFVLFKIISLWTSHPPYILNFSFLLSFPLTVLTSLFVFRRFNVSYASATLGALLFAFLYYHFFRGAVHLFLASYYVLPLMVMVILWVCLGEPLFFGKGGHPNSTGGLRDAKTLASILICILVGSGPVYYAFFAGCFLLVAGLFGFLRGKGKRQLIAAGILAMVILLTFLANLLPTMFYAYRHGRNVIAAMRVPAEAEMYGLKIDQLLLPVTGHRFPILEKIKEQYDATAPLINENGAASLGMIGGLGFLFLFVWLMAGSSKSPKRELLTGLGVVNLWAVLLATIGGLGALFALFISPQIRAYNRISVYIAFFSLFAVVLLLDTLKDWLSSFRIGKYVFYLILVGLLGGGILDQTTSNFIFVPPYTQNWAAYLNDLNFVRKMEKSLPEGSMVFQLPHVSFPEVGPLNRMTDYEHFRGYLHSRHLRWSYGGMKGRESDRWQRQVSSLPINEMIPLLIASGFKGIYIDRFGYPDNGVELEEKFVKILGQRPLISKNKRLVFFNLANVIPPTPS